MRPRWPKILVVVRRMLPGEHHGAMKQMNKGDTGEGDRCRARHVPVQSEFSLNYVITTETLCVHVVFLPYDRLHTPSGFLTIASAALPVLFPHHYLPELSPTSVVSALWFSHNLFNIFITTLVLCTLLPLLHPMILPHRHLRAQ